MPAIGDFKIITDGKVVIEQPGTQNFFRKSFPLPINTATLQSSVLQWMIHVKDPDDLEYEISLNGKTVGTYKHNEERFGTVHEVVAENVLNNTDNRFSVVVTNGEGKLGFSDVVLHFQHNV